MLQLIESCSYLYTCVLLRDIVNNIGRASSLIELFQYNVDGAHSSCYFHANLLAGPKARSYLLLLVRMKKLVVETTDGLISYKLL